MPHVFAFDSWQPELHALSYAAPTAVLIGQVSMHAYSSIWFGAVARGDSDRITIGERSNVQDLTMLHVDAGSPLTIGKRVTVGHSAVLHGCDVGDDCLIGIGAKVLSGARIGKNSLVAAGSLVPEGKVYPAGVLLMGSPARIVRETSSGDRASIQAAFETYVSRAAQYRKFAP